MGLGNGLVGLFKQWGRGIGNAADNFWLGADARKAISDEVGKKFQHRIDLARKAESRRAANIKDLDAKLTQSKKDLADAQKAWQDNYDNALAGAKTKRQTDIADYNAQSKTYKDALDKANASRQSIFDKLYDDEDNYDRFHTIFTDVNTGERFILNHITGQRESLTKAYKNATSKEIRDLKKALQGYGDRLYDSKSGKVINVFDESDINTYQGKNIFDSYYSNKISTHNADIRNAEKQIQQANGDLSAWKNNNNRPTDWDDAVDLKPFKTTYEQTNGKLPKEYSFNGQTYSKEKDLDKAYKDALDNEKAIRDLDSRIASKYTSKRDAEIAQRIQDAKDINKAKVALGAGAGIGALYAGAKALYGGDDTPDNTDNTNNIDNTDNTYTGEPDPDFNVEKEGQAILKDRQQVDSGFDPDKAEALVTLAAAAHDKGVEDSNSIESSGDLGNNIGATTRGHTMDDRLYELIKAMQDPYKADAVANYIYSRHGDDPEVQRLGWRGWLNKYYGDSLRSKMNIDPSGYKGMHISGGL